MREKSKSNLKKCKTENYIKMHCKKTRIKLFCKVLACGNTFKILKLRFIEAQTKPLRKITSDLKMRIIGTEL